jgi:hypothetical protein
VDEEFRPVDQFFVDGGEGFLVVGGEADAFPPLRGKVGALGGLEVEVQRAGGGVGADGCVARVG